MPDTLYTICLFEVNLKSVKMEQIINANHFVVTLHQHAF